jgi:hypothetical protein
VIGEPIVPPKWQPSADAADQGKNGSRIPDELVDGLHKQFEHDMLALFDKCKAAAGYPDAVLEVV